jgi:hypothetical protein
VATAVAVRILSAAESHRPDASTRASPGLTRQPCRRFDAGDAVGDLGVVGVLGWCRWCVPFVDPLRNAVAVRPERSAGAGTGSATTRSTPWSAPSPFVMWTTAQPLWQRPTGWSAPGGSLLLLDHLERRWRHGRQATPGGRVGFAVVERWRLWAGTSTASACRGQGVISARLTARYADECARPTPDGPRTPCGGSDVGTRAPSRGCRPETDPSGDQRTARYSPGGATVASRRAGGRTERLSPGTDRTRRSSVPREHRPMTGVAR